jgi:hypothetical protein
LGIGIGVNLTSIDISEARKPGSQEARKPGSQEARE